MDAEAIAPCLAMLFFFLFFGFIILMVILGCIALFLDWFERFQYKRRR